MLLYLYFCFTKKRNDKLHGERQFSTFSILFELWLMAVNNSFSVKWKEMKIVSMNQAYIDSVTVCEMMETYDVLIIS